MSTVRCNKKMPVCEDDLSALYRYLSSQKHPYRHKPIVETKSVSKSKQAAVDRPKPEITSRSKNETLQKPLVMHKNGAKFQVAQKNEVKITSLKYPEPLVHRRVGMPRSSRNEVMKVSKTMQKNEIKPQATYNNANLRKMLSSTSSTSSTKKASTSSSSTSNGDGNVRGKPIERKNKSPALPVSKKTLYPSESVIVGWRMSVPIGSGFVNLGNTCYLNSTLQALFHVPSFVYWLTTDNSHTKKCIMFHLQNKCLICPVAKTLHASHKHSESTIRPTDVYSRLPLICRHLQRGSQEDAHEFLRYLLEGMERSYLECCNTGLDNMSKETTPIGQIFGGYIRTEVACLECGHVSTTFQHFQDLILDIQSASSVDEALDQYFATESLGDEYKCGKCKRRIAATKKFFLEKPPKVLCVQLKRFEILGGKNNKHISLRQWVDLESYIYKSKGSSQLRYKLVSMILHHGYSSSCGHYTAVGLTSAGGYHLFDDSSVSPMLLNEVLKTNPYILMFELSARSSLASASSTSGAIQI